MSTQDKLLFIKYAKTLFIINYSRTLLIIKYARTLLIIHVNLRGGEGVQAQNFWKDDFEPWVGAVARTCTNNLVHVQVSITKKLTSPTFFHGFV